MNSTLIIAIVSATVVATGTMLLIIALCYYHWRTHELLANVSAFIRENLKLKDELRKLQTEYNELSCELDETKDKNY